MAWIDRSWCRRRRCRRLAGWTCRSSPLARGWAALLSAACPDPSCRSPARASPWPVLAAVACYQIGPRPRGSSLPSSDHDDGQGYEGVEQVPALIAPDVFERVGKDVQFASLRSCRRSGSRLTYRIHTIEEEPGIVPTLAGSPLGLIWDFVGSEIDSRWAGSTPRADARRQPTGLNPWSAEHIGGLYEVLIGHG